MKRKKFLNTLSNHFEKFNDYWFDNVEYIEDDPLSKPMALNFYMLEQLISVLEINLRILTGKD